MNPCYKCPLRTQTCHSSCPDYAESVEVGRAASRARMVLQGGEQADVERGKKIKNDVRLRGLAGNRRRSK